MIGLWLGGLICFVMGMWRDYRAGLPEQVIWAARDYPARFYAALLAGTVLWPLTMIGIIARVDADRAEREADEKLRAERAAAEADDDDDDDDNDDAYGGAGPCLFSHRQLVEDSLTQYIRDHLAPGEDRDLFLDVLIHAALRPCHPLAVADYHERRARHFRALAANAEQGAATV